MRNIFVLLMLFLSPEREVVLAQSTLDVKWVSFFICSPGIIARALCMLYVICECFSSELFVTEKLFSDAFLLTNNLVEQFTGFTFSKS